MQDQLTLGVRLLDEVTFDNFYAGANQEVIRSIQKLIDTAMWNFLFLYGEREVGKSHLLQAGCHYASYQGLMSFYLPLGREFSPQILENLDHCALVCIDNIECIAAQPIWEESLFHFFNRAVNNKTRLLIAGTQLPNQLGLLLPDLASRLSSGITYMIKPLSDCQKLAALQLRASIRGFVLTNEVGRYLLNHYPRSLGSLFDLLELLDKASLQAQHRITIPFVKSVLHSYSLRPSS